MKNVFSNKQNTICFFEFVLMCSVIIYLFLVGPTIGNNRKIVKADMYGAETVVKVVGYSINEYKVSPYIEKNHYVTFSKDPVADSFSIIAFNTPSQNNKLHIWYMDNYGNIIDEFDTKWYKNNNVFVLEDIPYGVALISISSSLDFEHYIVVSAQDSGIKNVCFVILFASLLLLIIMFFVFILKKEKIIIDKVDAINRKTRDYLFNNYKNIIYEVIVVFSVGIVSIITLYFCDLLNLKCLNGDIDFNYKTFLAEFLFIYILYILIAKRKKMKDSLPKYGMIVFLLIGFLFAFCEPMYSGVCWDDVAHYERATKVSHILDNKELYVDRLMNMHYANVALEKLGYSNNESKTLNKLYNDIYREGYYSENEANVYSYSSIVYLPSAIGLALSRGLRTPYYVSFWFGRYFNVIFCSLLCYFALKKTKYGSIVILLIALIPSNVFIASNYNYDSWTTFWIILGLSYVFAILQDDTLLVTKRSAVIISVSLVLSALVKQVYFIVSIIALFVPNRKFKNIKGKWIYRGMVVSAICIPFVLMFLKNIINVGVGDTRGGEGVNSAEQLRYIVTNFKEFLMTLFGFLAKYMNILNNNDNQSFFDNIAYNGKMNIYYPILFVLVFGSLLSHSSEKGVFPWWYRLGIICVYIGTCALCAIAMYVSFTPVGSKDISGCQGRYIIPVLYPLIYVLTRFSSEKSIIGKIGEYNINSILLIVMSIFNIYSVYRGCIIYY